MRKTGRAFWKGYLRLSLVTIAVEVYHAVESAAEISFRQIHKPTGKRINYLRVVPGVGEVANADIVKGYEIDKDTYVTLDPDEIEAVKLESKKTIDLVQFVDVGEIDHRYFERPYFVVPADELSAEGYAVIRTALENTNKVGLAQFTFSGREHLAAVGALGDGLVLNILRYANELRDPAVYFEDIGATKPAKDLVDLATQLIEQKSGPFRPDQFKDHYQDALRALVQKKMKGKKITAEKAEARPSAQIIDLMDALRKSVQGRGGERSPKGKTRRGKAGGKKRAS
jgi:DNA end-binding protein Ku